MKNILFPAAIVFSITANAQKPVFTQAQTNTLLQENINFNLQASFLKKLACLLYL